MKFRLGRSGRPQGSKALPGHLSHIPQMDRGFRHEICAKPWESQRFCPFPAETTEEPNG
jgi:hypothetical protein